MSAAIQEKPRCKRHGCVIDFYDECNRCHGECEVYVDDDPGLTAHWERCWQCGGRGEIGPFCVICVQEDYEYENRGDDPDRGVYYP